MDADSLVRDLVPKIVSKAVPITHILGIFSLYNEPKKSCDPFNLVCTLEDFFILVDETCLYQKINTINISANGKSEAQCKTQMINGVPTIKFNYQNCGARIRYVNILLLSE